MINHRNRLRECDVSLLNGILSITEALQNSSPEQRKMQSIMRAEAIEK